jgi:opacity protein-like surface antigen
MKATLALCALLVAAPAWAGDAWRFEATPYLWAAGMKGDVGVGRIEVDGLEVTFPDIVKSLRAGFMGSLEGRNGDYGFFVDAIYMQMKQKHPASRILLGDVEATATQQAYALAGTWRLDPSVDLFAGARSNFVKAELDLATSALTPAGRSANKSRTWWDGYVGVRGRHALDPRWTLVGYADLGAGESDLTWQVSAGLDYAMSPDAIAKFGVRYFKVEYDKDAFKWDMLSGGLFAGLALRF